MAAGGEPDGGGGGSGVGRRRRQKHCRSRHFHEWRRLHRIRSTEDWLEFRSFGSDSVLAGWRSGKCGRFVRRMRCASLIMPEEITSRPGRCWVGAIKHAAAQLGPSHSPTDHFRCRWSLRVTNEHDIFERADSVCCDQEGYSVLPYISTVYWADRISSTWECSVKTKPPHQRCIHAPTHIGRIERGHQPVLLIT